MARDAAGGVGSSHDRLVRMTRRRASRDPRPGNIGRALDSHAAARDPGPDGPGMNDSAGGQAIRVYAAGPLTTARPVAGFNGDRRHAMLGVKERRFAASGPGSSRG